MAKEKINWRSFVSDEDIAGQWNSPSTPSFYIIDHEGMIRHKWAGFPGETALDQALLNWIQKAEAQR